MQLAKGFAIATVLMLATSIPTYASDTDNMTFEELQAAYEQLETENASLKNEITNLKAQLFDAQNTLPNNEEIIEEDTTEAAPVKKTTEEFLNDIVNSYNSRATVASKYSYTELSMLSDAEYIAYSSECVESERPFYEEYKNAEFDDLNIQYLCNQYIKGLEMQFQIVPDYEKYNDVLLATQTYNSGYLNRAYVIIELADYYGAPFTDISDMRQQTAFMESFDEAETRNASVDPGMIKEAQDLLNGIGFYCGDADGVSGKSTVKSIKRFQEMYGYEPADGIIDEELLSQLQSVYTEKNSGNTVDVTVE